MKARTIKVKTYSVKELSDEAKEKVLEKYRLINVDYDEWADRIIEEWKEKLKKLGYENIKIYYSGFWSQGDGACFTADVNIEKWIKAHRASRRFNKLLKEVEEGYWTSITISHNHNYYYSTSTSVDYDGDSELSDKAYEQLAEMAGWIEQEREELGNQLYNELEKNYGEATSDESVIETLEMNGYKFLANREDTIAL